MTENELQFGFDMSKAKDFISKNKGAVAGVGAAVGLGGLALKGMQNKKAQAQAKLDAERKAEEAKEKAKTKRTFIIVGSVVGVVALITLAIVLKRRGGKK